MYCSDKGCLYTKTFALTAYIHLKRTIATRFKRSNECPVFDIAYWEMA